MRQGFMLEIKRPAPTLLLRHIYLKLRDISTVTKEEWILNKQYLFGAFQRLA